MPDSYIKTIRKSGFGQGYNLADDNVIYYCQSFFIKSKEKEMRYGNIWDYLMKKEKMPFLERVGFKFRIFLFEVFLTRNMKKYCK